jgi:dTDP-4-amino-4,6-dideoxygalactose transaminase
VRGISFPTVRGEDRSTYKDLALLVEPGAFGAPATRLGDALSADGIETRRYYEPPVHVMRAYDGRGRRAGDLPVTAWAADRALCLPLWEGMTSPQVQRVAEAVRRIHVWGSGTPSWGTPAQKTYGGRPMASTASPPTFVPSPEREERPWTT